MGINMRKKNPSEEREHEDEKYKFIIRKSMQYFFIHINLISTRFSTWIYNKIITLHYIIHYLTITYQ